MTAFLNCNYTEPDPATYTGVTLTLNSFQPDETKIVFSGATPGDDLRAAHAHIRSLGDKVTSVMGSSDMDHFEMDGGSWD